MEPNNGMPDVLPGSHHQRMVLGDLSCDWQGPPANLEATPIGSSGPEGWYLMDPRMLEPGWAGEVSLEEAEELQRQLRSKPDARSSWGLSEKPSLTRIAVAAYPEDATSAANSIRRKLAARRFHRIGNAAEI